jgi:flavin reductase (DIM6/NTAB) family NADH-FMN oxidoreductase RutF
MTASWGGLGVMWGKNIALTTIRPQRYTKKFIDNSNKFSLCFFDNSYKDTLSYLGTVSGKSENKIEKSNLTLSSYNDTPIFEESKLILICETLYKQQLNSNCFIDSSLDTKWYKDKDYHMLYISEIKNVLISQ